MDEGPPKDKPRSNWMSGFLFEPNLSYRFLYSENKAYLNFRDSNEFFSTGYVSGFFIQAEIKKNLYLKSGVYISNFREKIKYDSVFLFENKDSIVYYSARYTNSYSYIQLPIIFLKRQKINSIELMYGGGINLSMKKEVNAFVLDQKTKELIDLNKITNKFILTANIEMEISKHLTEALSIFSILHYQLGILNAIDSRQNFVQTPMSFGLGFGVKTNF